MSPSGEIILARKRPTQKAAALQTTRTRIVSIPNKIQFESKINQRFCYDRICRKSSYRKFDWVFHKTYHFNVKEQKFTLSIPVFLFNSTTLTGWLFITSPVELFDSMSEQWWAFKWEVKHATLTVFCFVKIYVFCM